MSRESCRNALGWQPERPEEVAPSVLERLAYPPAREGEEGDAALGLEAFERAQEPDDALLKEVGLIETLGRIVRGVGSDEREKRVDQPLTRALHSGGGFDREAGHTIV